MGTSLRLITSKLVTRSLLPTLVSSSCFHSIINAGHQRGYSTMPKDDFSDHSWLNVKCPKISHLSFTMRMDAINRWVSLSIPDEGLKVDLAYLPALKVEEMKAYQKCNFITTTSTTITNVSSPSSLDTTTIISSTTLTTTITLISPPLPKIRRDGIREGGGGNDGGGV
ncbi:hypothetical protein QVD17_09013 [Tagetes erecta]|uniref:Uncharacterized protein n=1 Tax=Tagetes erecta TaxID=13708 RepID=A0AAD8P4U6_TARER|nr:hypothetical protein QVD17_09013 [Tagetes erecta]